MSASEEAHESGGLAAMPGCRVALVADDMRLADAIMAHLKRLGHEALVSRFSNIRQAIGPESEGLLILAAASASDAKQALRLVQDICLQKWPPIILVVSGEMAGKSRELARLEGYVSRSLRWPDDSTVLARLIEQGITTGGGFRNSGEESIEEAIRRPLVNWTPSLLPMVEGLSLAAQHDVTVLLIGETGSGKSYLARLIHECSPRKSERFLVVPCGALAANLVESELFGHTQGAFTGADRPKVGKFAAAGNGTLLLDEIDALGWEQQANLLRVIETGEYEQVGSTETQLCTARIIVASNTNLEEAVARGKFRRDLYYRLNVMSFHLLPLRERVQDIAPLARGMAARFNTKFHKNLFDIAPEAMAALEAYPWPGNVRQLENVIQQAVLLSSGPELRLEHLPRPVQEYGAPRSNGTTPSSGSLLHNRQNAERAVIQRTLVTCGYSRAQAAHALGISRVTLYKKMKKYGLMEQRTQPA